jgi:tetratricopeptide (TPR) repeat protein
LRTARELIREHVPEQVPDLRFRFSVVLGLLLFAIVAFLAGMFSGHKTADTISTVNAGASSVSSPLTGDQASVPTEEASVTFVPKFRKRISDLAEQIQFVQNKGFISAADSAAFLARQKSMLAKEEDLRAHGYPKEEMEGLDKEIAGLNNDLFAAMGKSDPVKLAEVLPLQAWEFEQAGKYAQAQDAWSKLLSLQEKSGAGTTALARTKAALALPLLAQGNVDEAEPLLLDAEKTLTNAPDDEKKGLAHVYYGLAKVSIARGDYKKAASTLQQAIDRRTSAAGPSDPELVQLMQELAEVELVMGNLADAETTLNHMLKLAEEKYGRDSAQAADAFKDLGTIYFKKGDLSRANSFFAKSLAIKSASFGAESVSSAEVMVCMAMLYTKERKYKRAEKLFQRALEIRTRELGVDSPQAIRTRELYGTLQKMMNGTANGTH